VQGSGKTLAFLLPLVLQLGAHEGGGVRAVVLSPTRELAAQTLRQLRRLSPGRRLRGAVLTKAAAAGADFSALDILVATPLRLGGLLASGRISLARVTWLVMDEADKLFELGFLEQIDAVVAACSGGDVRRALFSATLPEAVEALARSVMAQPLRLQVGERGAAAASVAQRLLFCGNEPGKLLALRQLLRGGGLRPPAVLFVQSKERAKDLLRELAFEQRTRIAAVHADMSQAKRDAAVAAFRRGDTWCVRAPHFARDGARFGFCAPSLKLAPSSPPKGADFDGSHGARDGLCGRQHGDQLRFPVVAHAVCAPRGPQRPRRANGCVCASHSPLRVSLMRASDTAHPPTSHQARQSHSSQRMTGRSCAPSPM